jgi:hypothetical protein
MIRRIGAMAAAGALAFAGVAWAATAGTYTGSTSQHKGLISLKVSGGKVVTRPFVAQYAHSHRHAQGRSRRRGPHHVLGQPAHLGPEPGLKGPIRSMSLHLVIAGSPFVNTTYPFKGARETRLSTVNPGTIQLMLSYTDVTKGR